MIIVKILFSSMLLLGVDSAGTWVCHPCLSSSCDIANPYAVIKYSGGSTYSGGSVRCIDIQDNVNGVTKPTVCGVIQKQTFSSDNPCGCNSGGDVCEGTYLTNDACDLCQGLKVGDPNRTLPDDANYAGVKCSELEAMSDLVFDSTSCPKAQADANLYCQCTDSSVTQCVPYDVDADKSKCTSSDICCDGVCQYRGVKFGLICSTRYALAKDLWPDWALEEVPYPKNQKKVEASNAGGAKSDSTRVQSVLSLLLASLIILVQ